MDINTFRRRVISKKCFIACCCLVASLAAGAAPQKPIVGMSWNIYECQGWVQQQGACNTNSIAAVAKAILSNDPDWICLQEVDTASDQEIGHDHVRQLAAMTSRHSSFAGVFRHRHGGEWGEAILSKQKPIDVRSVKLPKIGRGPGRVALIAEFSDYVVCCTHLALEESDRLSEIEVLLNELKGNAKPVFLCGDLNSRPNHAPIRRLESQFLVLSEQAPTYPSTAGKGHGECIDYILLDRAHAKSFQVVERSIRDDRTSSDHRAVIVKLLHRD